MLRIIYLHFASPRRSPFALLHHGIDEAIAAAPDKSGWDDWSTLNR